MDCFYAAVEIRDNPDLINKPVAIGAPPGKRGVLCTANYIARKYGVRSAMSSNQALKLCPQLHFITPNFAKYKAVSTEIHSIFKMFTDQIEPLSLDEAYLDVTNSTEYSNSATMIAAEIKMKIKHQTGLTASAGVSFNKLLAKIASDWKKPNGLFAITPDQVQDFMPPLPIEKLFGVGKVTKSKLEALGLRTCADLQKLSLYELSTYFKSSAETLYNQSRGIDHREVSTRSQRKSISVENTYSEDLLTLDQCLEKLPRLFQELEYRIANLPDERLIKTVTVKVKTNEFKTTTADKCFTELNMDEFSGLLSNAFARYNQPVRLIGLGVRFASAPDISAKQIRMDL